MSELNINEDAQSGGESSQNDEPTTSQVSESAFPDEDEDTITMLDVIEREDKLEEEASAVLGNSDEKNCTYPKGYIPRQALYSCATCADGPDQMAAICLACSLECHDSHEVYELYTKRNYRCDCGNSKFKPGFECKLMDKQTKKLPLNEKNKYNHNFKGRYCVCDKKYPPDEADDSAESNDEMWQCIVCEDWYHTRHLEAKELPAKFDELICRNCVDKLDFVHYYKNIDKLNTIEPTVQQVSENEHQEDNRKVEEKIAESVQSNVEDSSIDKESKSIDVADKKIEQSLSPVKIESTSAVCESDTNDSQAENKDPGQSKTVVNNPIATSDCVLEKLISLHKMETASEEDSKTQDSLSSKEPLFWSDCSWRSKLCKCTKCLEMYERKECVFLLDDRDTVQFYEAKGKEITKDRGTPYERGMSALNRMNRAAVVEALHGYDELKADLSDYLRKFADNKKVVREEDIHEFFSQLRSKKRPRLEYE